MLKLKQKKAENPGLLTAQEFINVEDIADGLLYSADGVLFGYLSIRAGDNKLMSEAERIREAESMTASLAGETEPWQLMAVPRTVDTLGMISRLMELRQGVQEDARLKLLNGEISALQEMAREGTKEPMIVLKCWAKAARGADTLLKKRLHDLRSRLTENRVSCEIMGDQEITYFCKVFSDLSTYQSGGEDAPEDVPELTGEPRTLTRGKKADNTELLNLLTPVGGIRFGVSRTVVGSVVGRTYGAIKYPSELDYGWCVDLMNASDCVTAITYTPGNISILGDALSQSIRRSSNEAVAESDARRRKRFERQAQDADKLIDDLDAKSAAIGQMSLLVMPFTDKEEELEDVCHAVVSRYGRKRIKLKSMGGLQKEAYRQLSPYHLPQPLAENIIQHIMPLKTLLGGSPMVVNIYRDDGGYYFGRTMDGGIISIDFLFRGRDRTNSNMVAVGASGTGKSTTLKSIAETLYMAGVKVIIIDPEREFRDLCRNLSGAWLDAGGGAAKVNPLQIRPVPEDEEEDQGRLYQANDNAMALHIHTLDVFFKLYLPSLTDLQRALVKKALVTLYNRFGIQWDTNVDELPAEAFPLFSDFYGLLQECAKSDPRYEEIAALFYDMAEGADSFLWNGCTNVQVDNDFVVLDTNRLQNSSDEVKRAQYFNILTLCWNMISEDRTQPVFLLCDEAHILLDPAIPQTAMYVRNMAKRVRKYEGMLAVVLQSVVDALHEDIRLYGQAILDNAAYKFLFSADGKNLKETADTFQLTAAEQNILLAGERGKALCLIGSQHVHVDFDLPAYKLELMGRGGGR
ncbi:MAG: DUF87 domain-containing protein [Pseudoflavonifractor sp.]|nr:DUF87 domain-containing protein [Pseudoflavonifractor sp.]